MGFTALAPQAASLSWAPPTSPTNSSSYPGPPPSQPLLLLLHLSQVTDYFLPISTDMPKASPFIRQPLSSVCSWPLPDSLRCWCIEWLCQLFDLLNTHRNLGVVVWSLSYESHHLIRFPPGKRFLCSNEPRISRQGSFNDIKVFSFLQQSGCSL